MNWTANSLASFFLVSIGLTGCDNDEVVNDDVGSGCSEDADCRAGICLSDVHVCSSPCQTDDDCTGGKVCGVGPDGAQVCISSCLYDEYTCTDGEVRTSCAYLRGIDDSRCEDCGCEGGLRCSPGNGCVPLSNVGGECFADGDCRTLNCSAYAHVCRVVIGSECTIDDCDLCMTWSGGETWCSRQCDGDDVCNGGLCLGFGGALDYFWCRPPCSPEGADTCPAACGIQEDTGDYFCRCEEDWCSVEDRNRELLDRCSMVQEEGAIHDQCVEGLSCIGRGNCEHIYCVEHGFCSRACASDADCGGDGVCVEIGCVEGSNVECGPVCLPSCVDDYFCWDLDDLGRPWCLEMDHVDGGTAMACTNLREVGEACSSPYDCLSGRCDVDVCVPASGAPPAPNGARCGEHADCISESCVAGVCRGHGLVGDPCEIPEDCAVGTCCDRACAASCA
jgi:hypothetical protein